MDFKSIQNWVGHADYSTTLKIYTKIKDMDSKKEISEMMGRILPPVIADADEDMK